MSERESRLSINSRPCSLVWFRRDLRLEDHGALAEACRLGVIVPVFVLDDDLLFHPETAVARVAFLLNCLGSLDGELRRRGGRLLVRRGEPATVLLELARCSGAQRVFAHSDSERLVGRVRDARVHRRLAAEGIRLNWVEPPGACAELLSYGAWRQQWLTSMASPMASVPARLEVPPPMEGLADQPIPSLETLGLIGDHKPIPAGGTAAALDRLERFCRGSASRTYYWELSYPSARVSTGLSPYLKFGVVSPRHCLQRLAELLPKQGARQRSAEQLTNRLRWGCSMHQRFRYLPRLELRSLWSVFDLEQEHGISEQQEELYRAWQQGRTGFPIVDAAARCLASEGGWLELNFRSRAIYASFLANLCGIDWRYGALHFMRHLLDGDCPIDHYQWAMQAGVTSAGAGSWSRVYHPGQVAVNRCDPQGLFIRRWLPELAELTNDQLGCPPAMAAYPAAILNYEQARKLRLETLHQQRLRLNDMQQAMARLPSDLRPFASDRFVNAMVGWAGADCRELLPAALDLEGLSQGEWNALLSWFAPRNPGAVPARRRRQQLAKGQLSLDLGL